MICVKDVFQLHAEIFPPQSMGVNDEVLRASYERAVEAFMVNQRLAELKPLLTSQQMNTIIENIDIVKNFLEALAPSDGV